MIMLPSKAALIMIPRFLKSTPETTLTIPSTARKIISAGAYDFRTRAYADFSGRGFTRQTNQVKPDLVAPGVNIITAGNRAATKLLQEHLSQRPLLPERQPF